VLLIGHDGASPVVLQARIRAAYARLSYVGKGR
jgi:hypothetical protein